MPRPSSVTERGVRLSALVELQVSPDAGLGCADTLVDMQADRFLLDRATYRFHKYIVASAAAAVCADRHTATMQHRREIIAGELRALVGDENLQFTAGDNGFLAPRQDSDPGSQTPVGHAPDHESASTAPPSAWRKAQAICSSENVDFFIVLSSAAKDR